MNNKLFFIIIIILCILNHLNKKIINFVLINKIIKILNELLPKLIIIFILKSFIYEIYYIPSSSMMPTLCIGDLILVNKLSYNIKNPLNNKVIINIKNPKYGDIVVFQYPKNKKINYVKRIIGLPNDKIIYNEKYKKIQIYKKCINKNKKYCLINIIKYYENIDNKILLKIKYKKNKIINIKFLNFNNLNINKYNKKYNLIILNKKIEYLNNKKYEILLIPNKYLKYKKKHIRQWILPNNMYFVMGDFRDNSEDSRYWGYLNKNLIIGKVEYILINIKNIKYNFKNIININNIFKKNK